MEKTTIAQKLNDSKFLEYQLKKALLNVDNANYINDVQSTINHLFDAGWTKKDFYLVCMYINHFLDLQEYEHDIVAGFIDCLTGYCISPYSFPNSTFSNDHFNKFVHLSNVDPFSQEDVKRWVLEEIEARNTL